MSEKELPLLAGAARRDWFRERYNGKRELDWYGWPGGYPLAWYTSDGGTLCGKCANEAVQFYADHADEEDEYIFIESELPRDYSLLEEGPAVYCDECNKLIFEGLEECDGCGEWYATHELTFYHTGGGRCEKCGAPD